MPFRPTPGLILVIIVVFVLFIGGIVVVASSGGSRKTNKPLGIYTCTVSSNVGLLKVEIINQNTRGGPIVKFAADLPFSFNFTSDDTLQFNATVTDQFEWNAWQFVKTGTWDHNNPLTVKATEDFVLVADCQQKTG
jgi:hypothetical protein